MTDRVLFVDDEQGVLDGYERLLRKELYISVAQSGQLGLKAIEEHGPFAVVISDMRMPGMNGAEFLGQVRRMWPNSVRMLLTGYTDLNAAIAAVNEGNIFRFLTKPSTKEVLVDAINIGLEHYRSTTAEKGLLRKAQTVKGVALEREAPDICQWDNFEGPTGLGGPSQARAHLDSCSKINVQCYIVLLKLTALEILEQRYGEETVGDYLNVTAQYLVQSLRSEDRLFHWGRDVLMAVVRRVISADALRMEFTRIASARREHVINVNGRTIMIASSITFDLLPVSQRSTLDDMLAAFDANLSGRI